MIGSDWAGTHHYRTQRLHRPASVEELREIRDSVALHFTWEREPAAVRRVLEQVEAALEPFEPRPHWGKLFLRAPGYARAEDFARLAARLDPRGSFRNEWMERFV